MNDKRLFDLVRYMRSELHGQDLITDEEYAALACAPDSKECVARLETYDDHRAHCAGLELRVKGLLTALTAIKEIYEGSHLTLDESHAVNKMGTIACDALWLPRPVPPPAPPTSK